MRQASPSRLLTWGLYHPSPPFAISTLFSASVRFLFHFTSFEGWNSIYLKTHQTANFMNLQRFDFRFVLQHWVL